MLNKTNIALTLAFIAILLGISALVGGNQSESKVAGGTRFINGISTDTTSPNAGQIRGTTLTITGDSTVSGGTLNITTANTATSTLIAGCWQFYATSTATPHNFQASTTPGTMYSSYGSCPNL